MTEAILILSLLTMGIGATLAFVGNIFAIITTTGINKRLGLAAMCVPLLPIVYCLLHKEQAAYPLKLFFIGLALLLNSVPAIFFFSQEYAASIRHR